MAVKKTSGKLYRVDLSNYQANKASLPVYDPANPAVWKNAFEAAFTEEQVASLTNFSYTITRENEEIIYGMGCVDDGDSITLLDVEDRVTQLTAEVASVDYEMIADLITADYTVTVGAPIAVTAEAHGTGWVVGTPFALSNKNHDGTTVTAITVKEDNVALVVNTDYRTFVGEDGFTYVFPLTAQTGVITADYTYSVASGEDMHFDNSTTTLGRTAFKFVSCAYPTGELPNAWARDILYFTEAKLGGDITEGYYKKGDSFAGIEMTIACDSGSSHLSRKVGATKAAVSV